MNRRIKNLISIYVISFLCLSFNNIKSTYAKVYKWQDSTGHIHFTDNPSLIPAKHQNQIKNISLPSASTPAAKPVFLQNEGNKNTISAKNSKAITIIDKVTHEISASGKSLFSGKIRNNSDMILKDIKILLTLKKKNGKEIKSFTRLVESYTGNGILLPEEEGAFTIDSDINYFLVAGYEYKLIWQFAGENK